MDSKSFKYILRFQLFLFSNLGTMDKTAQNLLNNLFLSAGKDTCYSNFMCPNSSTCIMSEVRCDGIWDCENGTDEDNCSKYTFLNCRKLKTIFPKFILYKYGYFQ